MERRRFLAAAGVTATGLATGLAAPAIASGVKDLTMVMTWAKRFPGLGTGAERLARRIEAACGGRYRITVHGGGELVHPLECHKAVRDGTADLYHSADYYYLDELPGYAFFTSVPFGLTAAEMDAWLLHGGGRELWDEAGAAFGIKHFAAGNTGSQMGGWFAEPIVSVDSFKGLKMRMPGIGGEVVRAIGGEAVTLAPSDILPALESGAIDATEWVGPWNDLALGVHTVVKNYHYPGFHEPGTTLGFGVRGAVWDAMPPTDHVIIEACVAAENQNMLAEFNTRNSEALDTLITGHGVSLLEFPDEVFKVFGEASRDMIASIGASDPLTRRIHDSFMDFRTRAIGWSRLSDQSYMNKRALYEF